MNVNKEQDAGISHTEAYLGAGDGFVCQDLHRKNEKGIIMRLILTLILLTASGYSFSANEMYCGSIKKMRTWAGGNDKHGVWIEFNNNPTNCKGGFYIKHNVDNKELVYSLALASKMADQEVCIQTNVGQDIDTRCQLNYIMHK